MSTLNIQLLCRKSKKQIPKLSPFASWLGTIINPQYLEPPLSRTIFYGPKDVRAIEVRLYQVAWGKKGLFGLLSKQSFVAHTLFFSKTICLFLWLKFPFGLPLTRVNSIGFVICCKVCIWYNGSFLDFSFPAHQLPSHNHIVLHYCIKSSVARY